MGRGNSCGIEEQDLLEFITVDCVSILGSLILTLVSSSLRFASSSLTFLFGSPMINNFIPFYNEFSQV